MKNKLTTLLVAILVLFSVGSYISQVTTANQLQILRGDIAKIPTTALKGADGYTPRKGIDYNDGAAGANGINAISFVTNVVKEVPLQGIQGIQGVAGRTLQSQFDVTTGNFEQKYSDESFWSVVISCDKFVDGCPAEQSGIQPDQPNSLDSF